MQPQASTLTTTTASRSLLNPLCAIVLSTLVLLGSISPGAAAQSNQPQAPFTELDGNSIPDVPRQIPEGLACEDMPLLWQTHVNMAYPKSPLIVTAKVLYTASDSVTALDRNTGEVLWRFVPEGEFTHGDAFNANGVTALALDDHVLYFAGWQKALYAINTQTGKPLWRFDMGAFATEGIAFDNERVYVGRPRVIYAVNKKTGAEVWHKEVNYDIERSWKPPVMAGGKLLLESNKVLSAVQPATGEEIWRYEPDLELDFPGSPKFVYGSIPHVVGNMVITEEIKNKLSGIDLKTGERLWTLENIPLVVGIPYMVNTPEGKVILNAGSALGQLDPAVPKMDWWFALGLPAAARPAAVAGDIVLFGSHSYYIYAMNHRTGAEVFRYAYDREMLSGVNTIVADRGEVFYLGSGWVIARKLDCPQLEGLDIGL